MDKKFEKLVKPLFEYLKENYHPHTAIIITDTQAVIVEAISSIPSTTPGDIKEVKDENGFLGRRPEKD